MQRSVILSSIVLLGAGLIQFACVQDFDQFDPGQATGGAGGETASSSSSSSGTGGSSSSSSSSSASSASSASSTSSSSSSSSGGMPCQNGGDCPNDTDCINWSCMSSVCVQTFRPAGTPANDPTNGDCKDEVCDGMGGTMTVTDNSDTPPGDNNPCTTAKCTNGTPMTVDDPIGDPCPGGFCNNMAMCVECVSDANCPNAGESCFMDKCVSCTDGMMNGNETGVDCGGSCKKCDGTTCAAKNECKSDACVDTVCCNEVCDGDCKSCNINGSAGTCTNIPLDGTDDAPQCDGNNVCNGAGACKLKLGESCNIDADCASGKCTGMSGKTCTP